ncbi:sperm-associated antigen 8 isoform X2 [Heterocephalus glaber]|uniref:Sperm-associated antigen 8 isoform X2 n=2 Tax=Heterocephalus glaber TaxID=10181 RepID=A0AAX6QCI1_HETGA|nr:sperm-associated antigen 8 isoform X2 [Heterocephalus glaber]
MESGPESGLPGSTRFKTSAPQTACLHAIFYTRPALVLRRLLELLPSLRQPGSGRLKMETHESTQGSRSRALDLQPSSEGLTTTSEPFPSSDGGSRSALTAATAAAAASAGASTAKAAALCSKTLEPYSGFTEPSSDNLGTACAESHQTAPGSHDFEPAYVSCIAQDPITTNDLGSSPGPAPTSSSGPVHGFAPGSGLGPGHGSGQGSCPASGTGPGFGPEVSPSTPQRFRNLRSDLLPDNTSWSPHCHWKPQKQPAWEFLQVSEPATRGLWKPQEVEGKPKIHYGPLPRGQCLLYNWQEERATNHLDQVPCSKDGSESFFFRHGHQGLLTILQSPVLSTTTQKDSYQPPRNFHQPLRGKREAMLEMLLYHQICKEVQAEQEPPRKLFEVESVTHHDYQMELMGVGPPAPTKSHDYRQEQPETFWIQRAPQLPGVSYIRTLDTPFRKNCSFSTPVPLSLGQPLPYEPESYPHQMGEISSLACQGRGQGY